MAILGIKNPAMNESLLGALPDKRELLKSARSPKIVFVGGSNLSFGLDSRRISKEFQMAVVNMGIHANIGLKYMMNDVLPYVKKNDIVVMVPEYSHFYLSQYYGDVELVSILFDIVPQDMQSITIQQWQKLAPHVIKYAALKIKQIPRIIISTFIPKSKTIDIYDRHSFNEFGDVYIHWDKANEIVRCTEKSSGEERVNAFVISEIKEFKHYLEINGAELIILPPVYQACSFNNQQYIISKIETLLSDAKLAYLVPPLRYRFSDSLFYNTPSHLNKRGVDLRTTYVIEDLRIGIREHQSVMASSHKTIAFQ